MGLKIICHGDVERRRIMAAIDEEEDEGEGAFCSEVGLHHRLPRVAIFAWTVGEAVAGHIDEEAVLPFEEVDEPRFAGSRRHSC
jgi:hypothetical protein